MRRILLVLLVLGGALVPAATSAAAANSGCVNSAAVFTRNPIPGNSGRPGIDRYVAFTFEQAGVWYGYAWNRNPVEADAISWHRGQTAPTVLARYRYRTINDFAPRGLLPVNIVGVTAAGGIISAVGHSFPPGNNALYNGFSYFQGTPYQLRTEPRADTSQPVGVSRTFIAGLEGQDRPAQAVTWASKRAYPVPRIKGIFADDGLATLGVTDAGDLVYNDGTSLAVVPADGSPQRFLLDDQGGRNAGGPVVVRGSRAFASDEFGGIHMWDLSHLPAAGDIPVTARVVTNGGLLVVAVGPRGDVLFHNVATGRTWLHAISGKNFLLPPLSGALTDPQFGERAGGTIDEYGRAAVSLRADGLVHLFTCT